MTSNQRIRFYALWVLSLSLEYPLLILFFQPILISNQNIVIQSACAHLISSITLLFSYPKSVSWFYHKRKWPQFFFYVSLFLPILGHLIAVFFYIAFRNKKHATHEIFEEANRFLATGTLSIFQLRQDFSKQDTIRNAINFLPLVDILNGDDLALKRSAIEKLSYISNKESIATLKQYKNDPSAEVRFYITSAIIRIKKNFDEEIGYLKRQIQSTPDSIKLKISLADLYLKYFLSNLLDTHDQDPLLENAIFQLKSVLEKEADNQKALNTLMKCYQLKNDTENKRKVAQTLLKYGYIQEDEYQKINISALFKERQFTTVTNELHKLSNDKLDKHWLAFKTWWTSNL